MMDKSQSVPPARLAKANCHDIEGLVSQYYAYIHRLALSLLDDPAEADDAAQETFIAAHGALGSFRGDATPRTWLTAIAVNACRARLRRRTTRKLLQKTLQSLHLLKSASPLPEQVIAQNEADCQLWQAVDALDEKHRTPLVLRYVHELSVADIALSLGLAEGTVHSRLHYAREKIKAHLDKGKEAGDGEPR